jgi:hypothetical protein
MLVEAVAAIENASPTANRIIVATLVDPLSLSMQLFTFSNDIGSVNRLYIDPNKRKVVHTSMEMCLF